METDVPKSSVHTAMKQLFRNHVHLELHKNSWKQTVVKVRFCNWFYKAVCNGEVSPLLTGFTDKTT